MSLRSTSAVSSTRSPTFRTVDFSTLLRRSIERILDRAQLSKQIETERKAGKKIVLANGCFDVLHVGHVRYLQGAAAEADRLIVAVNDDESVRTLKGVGRPILTATEPSRHPEAINAEPLSRAIAPAVRPTVTLFPKHGLIQ